MRQDVERACEVVDQAVVAGEFSDAAARLTLGQYMLRWQRLLVVDEMSLQGEFERMINFYSAENESDTPDFVLAAYMSDCLAAFNRAVNMREAWYGRKIQKKGIYMASNYCPNCHRYTAYVKAVERGIDYLNWDQYGYIVNDGYYAACSECKWESELVASYDDAAKLLEGAKNNNQHSNGAEPEEVCPECDGTGVSKVKYSPSTNICWPCKGSGKLRHCKANYYRRREERKRQM